MKGKNAKGVVSQNADNAVGSFRVFSLVRDIGTGKPFAVYGIPDYPCFNDSFSRSGNTAEYGDVGFTNRALFEPLLQKAFRFTVPCGNDYPGSILVETMNNAGPEVPRIGKLLPVPQEGVYKRSCPVSRCRMGYHPLSLVYNRYMIVFIDDGQGNVFAFDIFRNRIFPVNHNAVPGPDNAGKFYH
jgi:hypothetical protein